MDFHLGRDCLLHLSAKRRWRGSPPRHGVEIKKKKKKKKHVMPDTLQKDYIMYVW